MKIKTPMMKAQRRHIGALELINDILLARARLTQAKSDLALARAQIQTALRRGKENKLDAGSTQRQVRHAEIEFIKARTALAKMEKNYLNAVQQTVRTPAQAKQPVPAAVRAITEKKPATVLRGLSLASSRARASGQQRSIRP